MYPVLFGFLPSFGVLVATGFLVGIWLWCHALARHGDDLEKDPVRASEVAIWLLVGVIAGARLMYVTVEVSRYLRADVTPAMRQYLEAEDRSVVLISPEERRAAGKVQTGYDFAHDPLQVVMVWKGGLVMYGGFAGAVLLGLWASRRRGLEPWNALDTALPGSFVGLAIGRWGCLLVGDDFGRVVPAQHTDLPFPLTITVPAREWLLEHNKSLFPHDLAGETLWCTQIWMSTNALLVALVAWLVLRRRTFRGQVAAVVFVHYAITRFLIEMFRGDEIRGVWFGGALSTSQLIALPGILLGIWIYVSRRRVAANPP
ncbi:MAG: prolipoprotein diacylglyceryl transferase [Planctomycetota bacterium]|nr:prolipoprotein diacylglyceryl transferase [Planctomycetota bacterium]